MSGLIGIWNRDGRPVNRQLLERMTEVMAHRGPDGAGHWVNRSVGLGHRMLRTTPESLHETQPLTDETNTLALVLDGRVDNREELKAAFDAKGLTLRTDTDAELVLKAYECWGRNCPNHLLGDFAFAIWDGKSQRLFCARDPMGCKPFYYYMDSRIFLCASELPSIFAHPAVRRECNEGMLGEYLASQITSQEETLYKGIYRLPPAHSLLVQPDRLWKERYWNIDPTKIIFYKTDQEYADHFLDLFRESVRCRLRSHGPVGSYLSGGLDSSSVVGMAQALYRNGEVTNYGFETFSLIFPGWPCDESPYIQDVVRMWGIPSNRIRPEGQDRAYFAECAQQDQDFPGYPNGTMGNPLRAVAQKKGIRVLLTGGGGDEWLAGSLYHAADLLRGLRILPMLRRVGPDADNSHPGEIARTAMQFGVRPLLPSALRRFLKRIVKRDGIPPWINQDFARRINLAERLATASDASRFATCAQADLHSTLTSGWWPHSFELEERAASRFGLEERHPLTDRRLVEFALALPEEQRWRGPQTKLILRHAMQGLLPELVRQRLTKAEFSAIFVHAFHSLGGRRFFDSLATASLGWVDELKVRRMYQQMDRVAAGNAAHSPSYLWPLWMIAGAELWLKAVLRTEPVSSQGAWDRQEGIVQSVAH